VVIVFDADGVVRACQGNTGNRRGFHGQRRQIFRL